MVDIDLRRQADRRQHVVHAVQPADSELHDRRRARRRRRRRRPGAAWTPADATDAAHDTVLSWQSNVERNRYGGGGGGGLFSKRYQYQSIVDPTDPNRDLYATGLEGVPIQVWTTKAFTAQWTAPIDPEQAADHRRSVSELDRQDAGRDDHEQPAGGELCPDDCV